MNKIWISILIVFLLSGCTTTRRNFKKNEFSTEKSYIGIRVNRSNQKDITLKFKNLDTEKVYKHEIKNNTGDFLCLNIFELPAGDYAVLSLSSKERTIMGSTTTITTYRIPDLMQTLISTENNSITYIGDLELGKESGYNYNWENLMYQIKENYYYSESFKVIPIEYMSIGGKSESNFIF